MNSNILKIIFCTVLILAGPRSLIPAHSADDIKPSVIIDAGHTNQHPGAISLTGKYEVEYNDIIVSKLSTALNAAGFVPILTRKPNQEIKLEDRVNVASATGALVMLSIHHDSAQLVHLESVKHNGKKVYRTRKPISGYSIFVSKKNLQFDRSLIFAKLLGEELLKLGRKPTLHHAEPIPGEGRTLLDVHLGIYQYDDLMILKNNILPAVLLEIGVIVDRNDEAYVTKRKNQEAIINATLTAINRFNKMKKLRSSSQNPL